MKLLSAIATAALALGLAGCPDDGDKCKNGDFSCIEIPDIELIPGDAVLEFIDAGMTVGQTDRRTIRIINIGQTTLDLRNVVVKYTPPEGANDGAVPAFKLATLPVSLPFAIEVSGGDRYPQGLDIEVEYTKGNDALARNAILELTSNDPLDPVLQIRLTTALGVPALAVSANPVDFGLVPNGVKEPEVLNIRNTGNRELNVTGFQIAKDGRFGFKGDGFEAEGQNAVAGIDLATPIVVPAGEQRPITVTFRSDSPLPAEGELYIYSDDPFSGANGFKVNLVANKSGPCITVNPKRIVFGGKIVGQESMIDFEIESCGTEPLTVSSITFGQGSSSDYTLDFTRLPEGFEDGPNAANALQIPVNAKVKVGVKFVPDSVNPRDADNVPIPDEGTVVIKSTGFDATVQIPVTGAGADVVCPTPIITVREGEEVIPQTIVHLSASQSYAPFGAITDTIWSVTPATLLLPNATAAEPLAALNSVGVYTFKLKVRDEFANTSGSVECPDATYQILVQPDQAIHVELTWNTPGDVDETDTGEGAGSDLDLHFAHQDGFTRGPDIDGDGVGDVWFDKTWDAFWYNPNPDWATFSETRDDPTLDRDDYDGAGPENLNLAIPQDGVTYRIGVHYWNDWGFGVANPTVKVFHYADEIYNVTVENMRELDMWCVGEINWPVPAVVRCSGDGQAITPRYINTFFQPPPGS